MKKHVILLMMAVTLFGLSSCMSIFSSSQQPITITGENGIKLYDATNNVGIFSKYPQNKMAYEMIMFYHLHMPFFIVIFPCILT